MGLFCIVWYVLALLSPNKLLLPSPLEVIAALRQTAADGELLSNAATSFVRLVASVIAATCIAVPLGLLIGLNRTWDDILDVPIELLRPIAGIAWIPLALFIFGIGQRLPIFIMFYTAFFPLLIGTAAGVRNIDRRLLAAGATMGITGAPLIQRIILPATLPSILVSLRLAVGSAWTAVVAAELVGAPSGLGYAIEYYRSMLSTPNVMAFISVVGLLGFLTDRFLRFLETRVTPWAGDPR
jgi:NitT/TauT family transport system permease protein/taurine transport system permease protein